MEWSDALYSGGSVVEHASTSDGGSVVENVSTSDAESESEDASDSEAGAPSSDITVATEALNSTSTEPRTLSVPAHLSSTIMSPIAEEEDGHSWAAAARLTPGSRNRSTPGSDGGGSTLRAKKGQHIGSGSFGEVFLGLNLDTGELLAIKQLATQRPDVTGTVGLSEAAIARLQEEINLMRSLHHPNIVAYLGTQRSDCSLDIYIEYMPGGSISSMLKKFGKFPETIVRGYTKSILSGLSYLHASNILHRDIKGSNLLVDSKGTIKLADFGSSKRMASDLEEVQGHKSAMVGTPYWMAPEVIRGGQYSRSSDMWSVGCVVLEMVTGRHPWSARGFENQVSAMYHIAKAKSAPPMPDSLSDDGKDLLITCFKVDPAERSPAATVLGNYLYVAQAAPVLVDKAKHRRGLAGGRWNSDIAAQLNGVQASPGQQHSASPEQEQRSAVLQKGGRREAQGKGNRRRPERTKALKLELGAQAAHSGGLPLTMLQSNSDPQAVFSPKALPPSVYAQLATSPVQTSSSAQRAGVNFSAMPLSAQATRRSFSDAFVGMPTPSAFPQHLSTPSAVDQPSPNILTQPLHGSSPATKFDLGHGEERILLIRWKAKLAVLKEAFDEGLLPPGLYKTKMEALVDQLPSL